MKITVKEIKNLNNNLKNVIESYENNYLNYYNYLNQAETNWYDTNSLNFFQTIEDDKKNDINTLQEMNSIYKLYNYLINNYEEIGQEILYSPEKKEQIINKLNEMIDTTKKIIRIYNSIGIYTYAERRTLYYQKNCFVQSLENIKYLKNKISNYIEKIERIENASKEEFSKITIEPIKEKDITPFM